MTLVGVTGLVLEPENALGGPQVAELLSSERGTPHPHLRAPVMVAQAMGSELTNILLGIRASFHTKHTPQLRNWTDSD